MKNLNRVAVHIASILFIHLVIVGFTDAQDNALNHQKYWWYKSRLNNDFVKVGINAGESMPFNQRGFDGSGFVNANANLNVGDGTSTLGIYIAVLATEFALLKKNAQNTDKVEHELFCALNAFDRLDYKAENLDEFGIYRLNGFFIRDDIPKNFVLNNYDHFNYYSTWDGQTFLWANGVDPDKGSVDRGFHSKCEVAMYKTSSSWSSRVDEGKLGGLFRESQDQVYNLLLGLAFVNRFLGQGITDGNNVFPYTGETDIREQARNQAKRIIDQLRNPQDKNGNDCNASLTDKLVNSWKIQNPVSCTEVPDSEGGDARAYAYALGEIECAITSNNYSAPAIANLLGFPFACPGSGYHNAYSSIPGYTAWQLVAKTNAHNPANAYEYIDTRVFNTNLSAMCNCVYGRVEDAIVANIVTMLQSNPYTNWLGIIINWVYTFVQQTIFQFAPGFYTNVTASTITNNAYNSDSPIDHGPIAHALLHGFQTYAHNPNYSFEYLINVAPCDGIYNFGLNHQSHYEWSSDSRCDHPNRRGSDAGVGPNAPKGEYNGLDFLFYHNLYYLYQSGPFGFNVNMKDLSDVYITQPSFSNAGNVKAFETITTENTTISYPNPSTWRAGKTIDFKPGTVITGNTNLHAYIQKFDCATD